MKDNHCTEIMTPLLPGNRSKRLLLLAGLWLLTLTLPTTLAAQTADGSKAPSVTTESTDEITTPEVEESVQEMEPLTYQSREERDMSLLAESQSDETVVWLDAMGEPFLSLYEQELTGKPVGAVLILNAEDQHSNWPKSSESIRLSLPAFGWSSLSTQLPSPKEHPLPKRTLPTADEARAAEALAESETKSTDDKSTEIEELPAEESDTDALTASTSATPANSGPEHSIEDKTIADAPAEVPVEEVALQRVQEAINFLHSKGQFNIALMGNGVGAARAACFINQLDNSGLDKQTRLIRALVLINARNEVRGGDKQLPQCLINPEIPVLDVYTGANDRNQLEARQRLKSSRLQNYKVYQQIRLPIFAHNSMLGENRLSRRVRGFLESHARGVKVDKAIILDR